MVARSTSAALLAYHVEAGHIVRVRRGLYVAPGEQVDPWLLGSRLAADAVLAYDGAVSFHGLAPLGHHLTYLTRERTSHFTFGDVVYAAVRVGVRSAQDQVERQERAGLAPRGAHRQAGQGAALLSAGLAQRLGQPARAVGTFELKGVKAPQQVFELA